MTPFTRLQRASGRGAKAHRALLPRVLTPLAVVWVRVPCTCCYTIVYACCCYVTHLLLDACVSHHCVGQTRLTFAHA